MSGKKTKRVTKNRPASKIESRIGILEDAMESLDSRIRAVLDERFEAHNIRLKLLESLAYEEAARKVVPEREAEHKPDLCEIAPEQTCIYKDERKPSPEPAVPDVKGKWAVVVDDIKYLSPKFFHLGRIGDSFEIVRDSGTDWEVKVENETQWIQKGDCYPVLLDAPLPEIPAAVWETKSPEEWKEWLLSHSDSHTSWKCEGFLCENCLLKKRFWGISCSNDRSESKNNAFAACAVEKARRAGKPNSDAMRKTGRELLMAVLIEAGYTYTGNPENVYEMAAKVIREMSQDRARLEFLDKQDGSIALILMNAIRGGDAPGH